MTLVYCVPKFPPGFDQSEPPVLVREELRLSAGSGSRAASYVKKCWTHYTRYTFKAPTRDPLDLQCGWRNLLHRLVADEAVHTAKLVPQP